jgi:hypothetical protein
MFWILREATKPFKARLSDNTFKDELNFHTKLPSFAKAAERCIGIGLPAEQPMRMWRNQISDISRF